MANPQTSSSPNWLRYSGYVLLGTALLIIFYAVIVAVAFRSGQDARTVNAQATQDAQFARQLELAQQDVASGNTELAERRLEELVGWAPNDPQVLALSATLNSVAPTPLPTPVFIISNSGETIEPTLTPSATPTLLPPVPTQENNTPQPAALEARLNTLEGMVSAERWDDAIRELVAFQIDYPNYQRFRTDTLLFDAYIGAGYYYTNGNRITRGINYFEQAEKLGPLTEQDLGQLYISRTYLNGVAFFGVNWGTSVAALDEVCIAAPRFHDACDLLVEARVSFGDELASRNDNCGATYQYQLALQSFNNTDLRQKWNTTKWKCDNPTPTPWAGGDNNN